MKDIKVAVLAGTPVDTAMGVEYIKNKNSETEGQVFLPLCDPVSVDCDAQVRFQYSDEDEKRAEGGAYLYAPPQLERHSR